MGLSSGFLIFAGILLLNSDFTNAQTRRNQSPRAGPTGRALGINPKGTSSSSSEFQCPEEFGYFPHPSDCSLYYVCVFGGALLESCTGGLMYSHELQTCDWPRNVGCEVSEVRQPAQAAPAREVTPRVPITSRVRFSSVNNEQTAPSGPSGPSAPSAPSAPAHIQQIQTIPPPPNQQRISPKPVITSRGQPPSFTQDEILKQLYEETHDTLPPAEEEETDRNQRVYRGQPSTVTQVQRDRDGIIHQPSHNAIPTQNKVGSFAFSNSQIPTFTSEDELQDLDITKHKVLDRKRRDLSSLTDINEESKIIKTEHLENESETETDSTKRVEKRSNDDETHVASLDEVSEILEGSENSDDVQRRTRQLRPSIISSPWRISNGRAVNFSPSNQNSFGSSFSGFPSAQSGFLYKSDGRFYPTNPFKSSSDDFRPVISTYSGNNNNKNKFNFQSFGSNSGSSSGYTYESSDQEATPKYKQSSKIPSQSSALLPLIYSLESFEPKAKQTTTPPPIESQDNYSYFHLGKGSSSQHQQQPQYQDKVKTYAFPITNQQPQQTTTQRSFVSFNSVGGFFNNNQHQSNQGFLPLKPIQSSSGSSSNNNNNNSNKVTPAPIYEGIKSASSYDSRYTSPAPIKKSQSTPQYSSNGFLNNLNFNKNAATIFNFGIDSAKEREKQREEKVIEITTKKQSYKQQYPIPTSTPKYIQSYTTPNQLFDVDKFIAELRETQRLQNVKNIANIGGNLSPNNIQQQHQQQSIFKINNNKTQSLLLNKTPNIRYQYFTSSTTASPDEYYYDDEDEEVGPTYDNGANLSKLKVQSDKVNSNKDNYSSHTLNKKPNLINSNAATYDDDDEYYEDYEDEEEEFKFLPPPINKPKYTPMTETMAPRPINVTTLRPYYVSGQTFSTPSPISSTIPSIIKFPDDVFQAIRPFTSLSPKIYPNGNNANKIIKTNHLSGSFDFTKGTSTTPIPHSTTKLTTKAPITTTSERTTTRKTKLKIVTKATTAGKKQQVTSTTIKPTRTSVTTTRRKVYTSKANNRGTLRFKPSTKRPDLTRLEIDEKLPNRVEQSSPAPSAFNIPSKTQITQNKNYYNTSNYNTNFDPFYPSYDDGVDIYSDVDYSNIYNQQPKSTPSSTYRPSTTQSPQTFATRPQTQSTTYLTQTPAPPKQKYNQQNIYSSADYDDGLVAQLEESERYGQQEEDSSNFRGDRNELSPTFERKLPKVQSPSSFSNGQKYSSVPAIVKLSTPEPFSYKPTVPVTQRFSSTFSTTRSSTKFPQTFPTTTYSTSTTTQRTTTTQEPPQYYSTRSSLSDGTNKTANNRLKITLSARAGSLNPLQKVQFPLNVPIQSPPPPPSFIPSIKNYTDTLSSTTLTKTSTSTFLSSTSTTKSTTTVQPPITPPSVQVVNIQLISNSNSNNNNNNNNDKFNSNSNSNSNNNNNNNQELLPDHYYYSEQDGPFDYYDNVDEISIPSSSIKPLVNNNIKNHHSSSSSSSSPSKSSSNSLSQSSSPIKSFANLNVDSVDLNYKLPNLSELRYDQSTLKSFFMNSNPTTENLMLASLRQSTVVSTTPSSTTTSTEKSTSTVKIPTSTRDFEEQRQRILSFIISENQPSSFKAPSTTTTQKSIFIDNINSYSHSDRSSNKFDYFNAFVNTQNSPKSIESTTTTTTSPRNIVQNSVINQAPKTTVLISREQLTQNNNKPIRLTLSSSLDGFEKKKVTKDKDYSKGTVEEIPLIKSRQPEVKQSLYLKPIEPTTYSPPKSYRFTTETTSEPSTYAPLKSFRFTTETTSEPSTYAPLKSFRFTTETTSEPSTYAPLKSFRFTTETSTEPSTTTTTEKLFEILNEDVQEDPESFIVHSRRRPYVNDFLTSSTIPTRFPPRTTTIEAPSSTESSTLLPTSTPRSIAQSFTSRGLVFKEILNKTLESQTLSKPIVSPYISLETQRLTNAIRTTTPRTNYINNNNINKESTTTSTTQSTPVSTYRSYFLITASPKTINNPEIINNNNTSTTTVPSTYLFPESSTTKLVSNSPTASPLILSTVKEISTSERKRGKYRPYLSFTSSSSNSLDDEATTYSPRFRFNTRTTESTLPIISSEQPVAVRRKVIRLKSALTPPIDTPYSSSTERVDVTTYNPSRKIVFDKFIPSQPRDSSDIRPILTKLNEFISKLSHSADIFGSTSKGSSYNDLTNENVASVVEVTEKPFYYTNRLSNLNNNNSNLRNFTELHDTTTKKFRATVEMPEMNVPEEKDEKINVNLYSDDSYDEEENEERPFIDIIDDHDEFIAAVNVESSTLSSTASPSPSRYFYNTSYSSTLSETLTTTSTVRTTTTTKLPEITSTTVTEPTTILRTTENVLSTSTTTNPKSLIPPRATRVNNAIKSSISAGLPRRNSNSASIKCNDVSSNAKCNEIPSRPSNRNPSRGSSAYSGDTQSTVSQNSGRGTSPTRTRPTLKPAQTVVKDAQQFVDIYRHPPTRPEPLYPQPVPDKTAAKCRKDVCLLPDCYCGGKDIPGKLPLDETPQLVLITFEDSVNDVHNKVFEMLFDSSRKNPNGCEIRATFFISHEWTDYGLVQDLYADGHEIASHTISHSFGEQFSLKKWAREIAGQREILSAYGGVKQEDIRGMRAPFLSIGGNKMFKMLYDFNFTYDSSMPVYENRPPSWPYTLDYKVFHDCMIPPCPTKSYPGVWEVPMVMWQDLNGGRCSMGDACSNPADSEGVYKMIMKNFERHYTTNRAPFGLFYHAAWFTQPHHKEGFIQFLDAINSMKDVYIVTNWQALQWVRDPTPLSRMQSFQPFQCNYQDRPKRCNNPKVCNLWHKSGVRYMRTCQPCPEIYPWTGKTGIRSSRIDNDLEVVEST